MQTHPQARHLLYERDGFRCSRARHHQAGGAQYTVAVSPRDRVVDLGSEAKIVGRDDDSAQSLTSRRSRRKAKNSTASRNRRFSISRLCAISSTIDAIFGARK